MTLLRTRGLTAGYGPVTVLHGLDLEVAEGEIVVILGANGAGKTTTMRAISGTIPRAGSVEFEGHDVHKSAPDAIVRGGIAQVPQGRGTFPELSVEDNLKVGAFVRRDGGGTIGTDVLRWFEVFPRLAERRSQRAGSLSGGEQQMLAIARGLMSRPRLLMLDEMSLGLMPTLVEKMMETVVAINRSGVTVLLVEQMVQEALEIAHRGYVLQSGRIVQSGPSRELLDSEEIRKAYMGM